MTYTPKVSVITAFHNEHPDLLKKCIDSVLEEDGIIAEFILIDDASTHKLDYIIPTSNSKVVFLKNHKNLGLTQSLNIGAKYVTGKYISRLDSNDFNIENRLKNQLIFLEDHPDIGFCGCAYHEVLPNGQVIVPKVPLPLTQKSIRQSFAKLNPFAHSTLMIEPRCP